MKAYTPCDMRNGDEYAIKILGRTGYQLMQRAAEGIFEEICHMKYFYNGDGIWGKVFVILCGKGNNGGDGYAVGKLLMRDGAKVFCVDVFGCLPRSDEALKNRAEFSLCGGKIVSSIECTSEDCEHISQNELEKLIYSADAVVDAIFGTGFDGSIDAESPVGKCIDMANKSQALKIAADCPSGVNALDGAVSDITFKAHLTVSLSRAKPGLFSYPAKDFCGRVVVKDIGIPDSAYPTKSFYEIADTKYISGIIPKRPQNSHKGTFGRLLCICGSKNMTGAASLCTEGALRSGVGLVNVASEKEVLDILKIKHNEPIFTDIDDTVAFEVALSKADAVAIGCGLSLSEKSKELVYNVTKKFKKQIIIDADGINALADNINVLEKAAVPPIITPHPLEFSRLSGLDIGEIEAHRINVAQKFATEHRCIIALKGAATVVTDGNSVVVGTTGNSGLAKGGSGDVLCGVIASLAAQGIGTFESAVSGVFVHGLASQRLSQSYSEFGVLPSDLPKEIGRILGELSGM